MKANNKILGKLGETVAAEALINKGYTIVDRNYANRFGEIDLIAQDGKTLVFVEVKAKTGVGYGMPEEMVSKNKLQRVRHMAEVYTHGKAVACRIDVVTVVFGYGNQVMRLTHYKNVY